MIYLDSRYADGVKLKAWDARKSQYHLTVFRKFPTYTTEFFFYSWTQGDRIDNLAARFLGDSSYWWQIMDINQEIGDPFSITPGTHIRIPNA
jgi:hypothetical protein